VITPKGNRRFTWSALWRHQTGRIFQLQLGGDKAGASSTSSIFRAFFLSFHYSLRSLLVAVFVLQSSTKYFAKMKVFLSLLIALFFLSASYAFTPQKTSISTTTASTSLKMAPRFDAAAGKWLPTKPEEDATAGYPAFDTFIRHGPLPFFIRLAKPDDYEQAVLKYMAEEKVDRMEAMGNMDAYFRNANDWAFDKMREKETGVKVDYNRTDPTKVGLTLAWTAIVIAYSVALVSHLSTGSIVKL
jgi:hypothetical protein